MWSLRCNGNTLLRLWLVVCAAACAAPPTPSPEITDLRRLAATGDAVALAVALDASMVRIPAGEFVMGSDTGRPDERPAHAVYLDAFELDRYEVTNAQYRRYLEATGRPPPRYWPGDDYPFGQADYPVAGVSWEDADAYCQWAGKRLLTEAEWEKACRGGEDARLFPWGNVWQPARANLDAWGRKPTPGPGGAEVDPWAVAWERLAFPSGGPGRKLQPIGAHPDGASPYGVMDMQGNVSEWVADWYNWAGYAGLPDHNPVVTGPPWNHSLRGAPWYDPVGTPEWTRMLSRCSARMSSHEISDPRMGFRCAR